jgi:predicted 2-oxoglutarate/Fe(II)-dependent dioxygenase YbiX
MNSHLEKEIRDLLDPDKGFILRRGFLSTPEVDDYRNECWEFLKTTRTVFKKIHRYSKRDYVWSTDGKVVPGIRNYRIYQSMQSKHSDQTQAIFNRVLSLRNHIESSWLHDKKYSDVKMRLYDYVQVTSYGRQSEGNRKHTDYRGDAPYPLLQPVIFLSQPGIDYVGGDLLITTKRGHVVNVQETLQMRKGDLLLFDKSLYHEVLPIQPCEPSQVGKWSVVLGGRYPQPPSILERLRRFSRARVVNTRHRVLEFVKHYLVTNRASTNN